MPNLCLTAFNSLIFLLILFTAFRVNKMSERFMYSFSISNDAPLAQIMLEWHKLRK